MFSWEIYEIFRIVFTRNTSECPLLQVVVTGKCFDQNIFFKKISFDFSHLYFDIQWNLFPGIKDITDLQKLNIWVKCIVIFSTFTFKVEAKGCLHLFTIYQYLPRILRIKRRILNP